MKALLRAIRRPTIIWAHIGLGRIVHPGAGVGRSRRAHRRISSRSSRRCSTDPALRHVYFDISWDEVAKYAVAVAGVDRRAWRRCSTRYSGPLPLRHRHGRARRPGAVLRGVRPVGAGLARLTPEASLKVRKGNYERIFDEGRRKVRAWEKAHVQ